ncbi:MAG: hypothetical protein ABI882_20225 [Acidobacteriota bacterium]
MNRRCINLILLTAMMFVTAGTAVMGQGGSGRLPGSKAPKPKPTPAPPKVVREESVAPPTARPPAKIPIIAYNQLVTASLDPRTAGQIKAGIYYDEYVLEGSDDDLFTIFLQSPNPGLTVQVYDKDGGGLPTLRDPRSGEFKLDTQGGTLPAAGEYRLRIVGVVTDPAGYTIRLNRTGLTEAGYQEKLQSIILAFNAPETKNVDDTISKLERLADEDGSQSGAYELLGVMYLYHRNDTAKAAAAMENAIKLKGAAVFRVTHDPVLGRAAKRKPDGQYDWVESRTSWLRVQPDMLALADMTNEQEVVFSLNGSQIREALATKAGTMPVISIKTSTQSKGYTFSPGTKSQAEVDLILKFLRTYVPPRG